MSGTRPCYAGGASITPISLRLQEQADRQRRGRGVFIGAHDASVIHCGLVELPLAGRGVRSPGPAFLLLCLRAERRKDGLPGQQRVCGRRRQIGQGTDGGMEETVFAAEAGDFDRDAVQLHPGRCQISGGVGISAEVGEQSGQRWAVGGDDGHGEIRRDIAFGGTGCLLLFLRPGRLSGERRRNVTAYPAKSTRKVRA